MFLDDLGELGAVDVSGDVPDVEPPGGLALRRRRSDGGFLRNGAHTNSLQAQSTRGEVGRGGRFERERKGEGLEVEDRDRDLLRMA